MYKTDTVKKKLYDGLVAHFPTVPKWLLGRTVELANSPVAAFDAIYDFKPSQMPVIWDFEEQKWKRQKVVLE